MLFSRELVPRLLALAIRQRICCRFQADNPVYCRYSLDVVGSDFQAVFPQVRLLLGNGAELWRVLRLLLGEQRQCAHAGAPQKPKALGLRVISTAPPTPSEWGPFPF